MQWFFDLLMSIEGFDPFVASWCCGIVAVLCVYFPLRAIFSLCTKR